jgi:hypothetical protein
MKGRDWKERRMKKGRREGERIGKAGALYKLNSGDATAKKDI